MKHRLRYYTLIVGLFLLGHTGKAQYVTIPDNTFANWLTSNGYAGCMVGNQLDTTCGAVVNTIGIYCNAVSIEDLTGIQYFKNLDTLDCSNNLLIRLPILPPKLVYLNCNHDYIDSILLQLPGSLQFLSCESNYLHQISSLPASLRLFDCYDDQLNTLPNLPDTLQVLDCSSNKLTALPSFPISLQSLSCFGNNITSLPSLPDSLIGLQCDANDIGVLPILPSGLISLQCANNRLTLLPTLPLSLTQLECDYNKLTTLPLLPVHLTVLTCDSNLLTQLPVLPSGLFQLSCRLNQLDFLPTLPYPMNYLYCDNNKLTSLPTLPGKLRIFSCAGNKLIGLPNLPINLFSINCPANQLSNLPMLPSTLTFLNCSNNPNLTCLPELPHLSYLYFDSTAIACLPNFCAVDTSSPSLGSLPLCGVFNPNGCQVFWNISGQAYYDQNNDCQFDSIDAGTNYVKTQLYSSGTLVQQTFSGGEGFYSFDSVPNGTYTVQVDTSNLPFTVSCPDSDYYTVSLTPTDTFLYNNNFAFKCRTQGFDLGMQSVLNNYVTPRPNATFALNTIAGDISEVYGAHCAAGISGQVQISFSGQLSYVGPATGALTPTTVNGNTIIWTIADYGAVNDFTAFNLLFKVDSLATAGSSLCFTATVTPTAGDYNPSNNTLTYCFPVVASLDPNEKEVYPSGNTDTSNHWLTYTIRFQNTGSAAAVNIRITDTLDSNLDPPTFQLLAYSAKNLTQIFGNDVVFNFPNINLPDSATSDSASRGFVQYRIKLKDNLPVGTQIQNTADIYFDLNPAVITNTTINTITTPTGFTPFPPVEKGWG